MALQPYLFFSGDCEEALNVYKGIFGGQIKDISRFKDMPPEQSNGNPPDGVMHATFESPHFTFMASDSQPNSQYGESRISLCVDFKDASEAQRAFDGLAKGGKVETPMQDMFWGARFGMLTDRFGIDWMITAPKTSS
jgi:PhnB protein